ncbi:MAG: hypothetical protein WC489_00590 [Patescibacteria group bacterium]
MPRAPQEIPGRIPQSIVITGLQVGDILFGNDYGDLKGQIWTDTRNYDKPLPSVDPSTQTRLQPTHAYGLFFDSSHNGDRPPFAEMWGTQLGESGQNAVVFRFFTTEELRQLGVSITDGGIENLQRRLIDAVKLYCTNHSLIFCLHYLSDDNQSDNS